MFQIFGMLWNFNMVFNMPWNFWHGFQHSFQYVYNIGEFQNSTFDIFIPSMQRVV